MKPIIGITMGDPAGIGPEIILKALKNPEIKKICTPVIFGDEAVLKYIAKKTRFKGSRVQGFKIINISNLNPKKLKPGSPDKACGIAMMTYIKNAVEMALRGDIDAVVTGPINKDAINKAGYDFQGHTEYLAHLTNTKNYAMMLAGKNPCLPLIKSGAGLKVSLVTIHEAIKDIPHLLKTIDIFKTICITNDSLKRYFGIKEPRLAVCALNPHAGEKGLFGNEEKRVIIPAVKKARALGINASPPLPSDTLFYRAVVKKEFDAVICMYHDQGLIPLKLLHFEDGVNITLGLPIIRTSVDHGTAYDIAWKGIANPKSMIAAIEMAVQIAKVQDSRHEV